MQEQEKQRFEELLQAGFREMNEGLEPSERLLQQTRGRMAAAKPQKWLPRLRKALAVTICTCVIFVGAVNLSPAFATAAAKVPIVRELVAAVSWDASMKAAIEHNYVQLVKQSDSDNGYQLEVEYLVADKANLTVYYFLRGVNGGSSDYRTSMELQTMDGEKLEHYGGMWDDSRSDELQRAQFNFTKDGVLPEQVKLYVTIEKAVDDLEERELRENMLSTEHVRTQYEAPEREYEQVATLTVPLHIDRDSLFNVRVLELNRTVTVGGQQIVLEKVEIYPTQVRICWHEQPDNSCWIDRLCLSLQSKQHGSWNGISNGVSGTGQYGGTRQVWLDSNWFSDQTDYQLVIEQYSLVPKATQQITYDYASNQCTNLPDYIQLKEVTPCDKGLLLQFEIQSSEQTVYMNVFGDSYLDSDGIKQEWKQVGGGRTYGEDAIDNYPFYNQMLVKNYEHGPITLTLQWAPLQRLEQPLTIPLSAEKEKE